MSKVTTVQNCTNTVITSYYILEKLCFLHSFVPIKSQTDKDGQKICYVYSNFHQCCLGMIEVNSCQKAQKKCVNSVFTVQ